MISLSPHCQLNEERGADEARNLSPKPGVCRVEVCRTLRNARGWDAYDRDTKPIGTFDSAELAFDRLRSLASQST